MLIVLDLLGAATALAAAWLWLRASQQTLRRVSLHETLDAADINRLIVAINRAALLNRRGAMAATLSALCVAVRFVLDLLPLLRQ